MGHFRIEPFTGTHTVSLLDCWNNALPYDAITRPDFERRVLLDANRHTDGLLVAINESDEVIGFISCFVLRRPIGDDWMADRGFIQAVGVRNQDQNCGVGSALLAKAEEFFSGHKRTLIVLSPYTPNYFVPGVDKDNYRDGYTWMIRHGFAEYSEGLAADACIATFTIPQNVIEAEESLKTNEAITFRHLHRDDMSAYLDFQQQYMPAPWLEDARRNLVEMTHGRFPEDSIWVALNSTGDIIGFCQHEHEHFGPFGVIDAYQGKNIGSILLAKTLLQMRMKGCHSAWVLWTGERALKGVYGRLGFKLTRRFALMKKTLEQKEV